MRFFPQLRRDSQDTTEQQVPLKLVVGLGNPGARYERTRHNVGFMCVNCLAQRAGLKFGSSKQRADVARGAVDGIPVLLAQPQTFMNDSGRAVQLLARYYHVAAGDIVVVYDDIDLPFGAVRVRPRGSSGGHRGIQSIIDHLGTLEFPRVKVGVGRGPGDAADYVLSPFSRDQERELSDVCDRAADAVVSVLQNGPTDAMNRFNGPAQASIR